MNILYICNSNPLVPDHGNAQRTHFFLKALQEIGDVYTIRLIEGETKQLQDKVWELDKPQSWNVSGLKKYILRLHYVLYKRFYYKDLDFGVLHNSLRNDIMQLVGKEKFDAVVCRYVFNAAQFHLWNYGPLFIDFDDHPYQLLDTLILPQMTGFKKWIVKKVTRIQMRFVEWKMSGGWITNDNQQTLFSTPKKISALPNIPLLPSENYNANNIDRGNYIFTIGLMAYEPNYSGVDRFVTEIWPIVHKTFPKLKYAIGGGWAPKEFAERWNSIDGVEYLGFVDNIHKMYEDALASLVPVDSGGGTCIKTIESMSHSRVCLSTPFGARGFEGKCDVGLYVYNDAEEFIKILNDVVFETEKRNHAEFMVKSFVDEYYSFEKFKTIITKRILNNK